MPRFFTPPDIEYDMTIPKILIRNCDWTEQQILNIMENLSEKTYDVYLYNNVANDVQWFEGIRGRLPPNRVYDCNHYKGIDPFEWMKKIDDEF